jgi:hypothetical protein
MLDAALERIAEKLRQAQAAGAQPFGAEQHGMRLRPPLAPDNAAAAEARLGVALPEDYRAFVTRVGDGGAGPAYGMFSLDDALRRSGVDRVPELLRLPFRHVERYEPEEDEEWNAFWDRVVEGEVGEAEKREWPLWERRGALELCDEGCGYLHFLVVTGPARGTMWIDHRSSSAGFEPLRVTFLEWYERWLDDALRGGRGTWWIRPVKG